MGAIDPLSLSCRVMSLSGEKEITVSSGLMWRLAPGLGSSQAQAYLLHSQELWPDLCLTPEGTDQWLDSLHYILHSTLHSSLHSISWPSLSWNIIDLVFTQNQNKAHHFPSPEVLAKFSGSDTSSRSHNVQSGGYNLSQLNSKSNIQDNFWNLEIKSFHLAPRFMGLNALLMEKSPPKDSTEVLSSPL